MQIHQEGSRYEEEVCFERDGMSSQAHKPVVSLAEVFVEDSRAFTILPVTTSRCKQKTCPDPGTVVRGKCWKMTRRRSSVFVPD